MGKIIPMGRLAWSKCLYRLLKIKNPTRIKEKRKRSRKKMRKQMRGAWFHNQSYFAIFQQYHEYLVKIIRIHKNDQTLFFYSIRDKYVVHIFDSLCHQENRESISCNTFSFEFLTSVIE